MRVTRDDERLLAGARRLREEAHALLYGKGVFDLIAAVGPARVVGSVDLDLMTWPDVDVNVRLPHDEDVSTFFDLGKAIAERYPAFKMGFSRHSIRPDVPIDWGLYWGVRIPHAGATWKLDLWGVGEGDFFRMADEHECLKRRLKGVDRLTVLRVKDHARRRPDYLGGMSVRVYEAVTEHGVKTPEDFDAWLAGLPDREPAV